MVDTSEPFIEETWSGALTIGCVRLSVEHRIERCRMIDIAQEGLPRQGGWLKALGQTRDANLGVYLEVAEPGTLRVGDEVLLTG